MQRRVYTRAPIRACTLYAPLLYAWGATRASTRPGFEQMCTRRTPGARLRKRGSDFLAGATVLVSATSPPDVQWPARIMRSEGMSLLIGINGRGDLPREERTERSFDALRHPARVNPTVAKIKILSRLDSIPRPLRVILVAENYRRTLDYDLRSAGLARLVEASRTFIFHSIELISRCTTAGKNFASFSINSAALSSVPLASPRHRGSKNGVGSVARSPVACIRRRATTKNRSPAFVEPSSSLSCRASPYVKPCEWTRVSRASREASPVSASEIKRNRNTCMPRADGGTRAHALWPLRIFSVSLSFSSLPPSPLLASSLVFFFLYARFYTRHLPLFSPIDNDDGGLSTRFYSLRIATSDRGSPIALFSFSVQNRARSSQSRTIASRRSEMFSYGRAPGKRLAACNTLDRAA